jgi:hypothetical protein
MNDHGIDHPLIPAGSGQENGSDAENKETHGKQPYA